MDLPDCVLDYFESNVLYHSMTQSFNYIFTFRLTKSYYHTYLFHYSLTDFALTY
ncbi:hypothetical protein NTG1052_290011 [Candidatus Nitrotoga sp. 1052]|nr:hypothetical protein NTG1052_290011 [Candidatus Nitrotoga sp. 1052]